MTATPLRVVLYEGPGSEAFSDDERFSAMKTLLEKGYAVTRAAGNGAVAPPDHAALLVLGKFDNGQAPETVDHMPDAVPVQFKDVTSQDAAAILKIVETIAGEQNTPKPGGWKPWFPVIDYSRCTNCMQCLSFCLFDVYGVSEEKQIQVQNHKKCKTDCPACSRVCPEVAILFPKYRSGPINGDEVSSEDLAREKMKIDITSLLGGDIYAALRDRSARAQSRFTKERDDERALKERQRCLQKLQADIAQLEIPPEVMMSLPSPDEIRLKAERAMAAAAAAKKIEPQMNTDRHG